MSDQIEMFPSATKARDAALQQVRENSGEWHSAAIAAFNQQRRFCRGQLMTSEHIRQLIEQTIGPPHHHNAWGSIIRTLAADHFIVDTGNREKGRTIKSHAREVRVWRVL